MLTPAALFEGVKWISAVLWEYMFTRQSSEPTLHPAVYPFSLYSMYMYLTMYTVLTSH